MTGGLYLAVVAVHVLAAVVWLGGVFFLVAVAVPALRGVRPDADRRALFEALGRRFRLVGWPAVAVSLATGVLMLHLRRWLVPALDGSLWSTWAGGLLGWKLAAVAGMLVLTAAHDLGHRSGAQHGPRSALYARAGAVFGLLALLAAVRLSQAL